MTATGVVLVGDVVASRRVADEGALLAGLDRALATVEAATPGRHPLQRAVRDSFHGVYDDLGTAARAALRLRLATDALVLERVDDEAARVELRLGLGVGTLTADGRAGTAWRHATDARAEAEALPSRRGWPPSLRSRGRTDDSLVTALVDAHLLLQDQLLARLDDRDRRALLGLLDGERQVDVAAALGISQPAVARRLRDRGALALHRAVEELGRATSPPAGAPSPGSASARTPG